MSYFTSIFTAGLALFLISSQVRGGSIRVVLSKPCKPEVWLVSAFLPALYATVYAANFPLIAYLPGQVR